MLSSTFPLHTHSHLTLHPSSYNCCSTRLAPIYNVNSSNPLRSLTCPLLGRPASLSVIFSFPLRHSQGNTVNLYHVRETGWEFIENYDLSGLWYKYQDEKAERIAASRAKTAAAGGGPAVDASSAPTGSEPVAMET
jgi:hypothetical protein